MAITFPREIPEVGYKVADFILRDTVRTSAAGARRINYTQIADPAWTATLVTVPLDYWQFTELEAWWLSLRDGVRGGVLYRHPRVCYPRNHTKNQAPADDAGNLTSVIGGNVLSVNSVDAGLSLVIGDRIGLERAGKYHVGKVTEVSGSGDTRTIAIEPPPSATVSAAGSVVRFARPALLMRPVPDSWDAREDAGLYTISFKLVEA